MAIGDEASIGLSNLAHAIRRSMALYVAMNITEQGSSIEDLLDNADRLAAWIGGKGEQMEREAAGLPPTSIGVPWHERDQT